MGRGSSLLDATYVSCASCSTDFMCVGENEGLRSLRIAMYADEFQVDGVYNLANERKVQCDRKFPPLNPHSRSRSLSQSRAFSMFKYNSQTVRVPAPHIPYTARYCSYTTPRSGQFSSPHTKMGRRYSDHAGWARGRTGVEGSQAMATPLAKTQALFDVWQPWSRRR